MKKGSLYLIATPISADKTLHQETKSFLLNQIENQSLIVVEELKECRRRWLSWGMPRESIEQFEQYNEHNRSEQIEVFISQMKKGRNICLLSDCGLPAFCDPGMRLVDRAHDEGLIVSATNFDNSIVLALALSGFSHDQFWFAGFLSKDQNDRRELYKKIEKRQETAIIMDTPYRLTRVLEEFAAEPISQNWLFCLACDLGSEQEVVSRGKIEKLTEQFRGQKREFIMVIAPNYGKKMDHDKSQKRSSRPSGSLSDKVAGRK